MSDYQIDLSEVLAWFRSKEQTLKTLGITLADVRESHTVKSSVAANFDTVPAIGQIIAWVSGEIDFQVLRASDGKAIFLHGEIVSSLNAPSLDKAYNDFLRHMTHPEGS